MAARTRLFLLLCGLLILLLGMPVSAQTHGVPASVTSFGFGGSHSMTPGVPASVTSLGPNGFGRNGFGGTRFFGNCCGNVFVHGPAHSGNFHHGNVFPRHRHGRGTFFGGLPVYAVPYYYPDFAYANDYADDDDDQDAYAGAGPTVFERHGQRFPMGTNHPAPQSETAQPQAAAAPELVSSQPSTVIVFKDGHQVEIQNYAIVSGVLFDLSEGRAKKIQLADLDLSATRKANDDRGIDFQVPAGGN